MAGDPNEQMAVEKPTNIGTDRRRFMQGAVTAGMLGAMAGAPALGELTPAAQQGGETQIPNNPAYERGYGGSTPEEVTIPPDIQADIARRAKLIEELPKPSGLRPNAQLDARFSIYFETSVPEAMRLATQYFAAVTHRDVAAAARTLHFPYATYEGVEPLVYETEQDFISNPPPSLTVSDKADSQLRPGTYDIMDALQLRTYDSINVGLELCYTRYRADGHRIGVNQGIYSITNNDGKWGIQLSSIIFTPERHIGIPYNDAVESWLRQNRNGQLVWTYHDTSWLNSMLAQRSDHKSASVVGAYNTDNWLRSSRAGVPMEPYNSKGIKSRLLVSEPNQGNAAVRAAGISITTAPGGTSGAMVGPNNSAGYFYNLAGQGVGKYAYTLALPETGVLHASPDKAHIIGGYIRYTSDNHEITETRTLAVIAYDLNKGTWGGVGGGMLGGMVRRDCTNDPVQSH